MADKPEDLEALNQKYDPEQAFVFMPVPYDYGYQPRTNNANPNPPQDGGGFPSLHRDQAKYKKYEVETCECGHVAPIEFIHYDTNACGTCPNCVAEYLALKIKALKKKIKKYGKARI